METNAVEVRSDTMPKTELVAVGNRGATKWVQHFTGSRSARDIKARLKAAGTKGKELTAAVNRVLRGEKDMREQLGVAWLQATIQDGFVPDKGERTSNGALLRLVKVREEAPAIDPIDPIEAAAVALGITAEQLRELAATMA